MKTSTAPVRHLEAVGFSREQAEAIVDAHTGDLATKADIAELKADILKVAIGIMFGVVALNATLTYAIIRIAMP